MPPARRPMGMTAFTVVWLGQFTSLLGTGMTRFALSVWAWQLTGQATALALVNFFAFAPTVLLSPFAGAMVDRTDRKRVMMLSDLAAALATAALLALYLSDRLQIWHLYVTGAFAGAFQSFQFPAYSAAVTMMLPKGQYARASGMLSLADSASQILAPIAAGALLLLIGVGGIMAVDVASCLFAVGALLVVHIPSPPQTEAGLAGRGSIWTEAAYGFRYILARPSLLGLQLVLFGINLTATFAGTLLAPLVLARTANDQLALGSVMSAGGVGGVAGGLAMSLWGGPKRRVHGLLLGMALGSLGQVVLGLGQSVPVWLVGAFGGWFFIPLLNASNQAIWQAKVAPDVQGRVFAARRMIAQVTAPVAMLLAGPLADRMFEPAMREGGALAGLFGGLVGVGAGAGISLIITLTGLAGIVIALAGYLVPAVRDAEDLLPDHSATASPQAAAPA